MGTALEGVVCMVRSCGDVKKLSRQISRQKAATAHSGVCGENRGFVELGACWGVWAVRGACRGARMCWGAAAKGQGRVFVSRAMLVYIDHCGRTHLSLSQESLDQAGTAKSLEMRFAGYAAA